MTLRARVKICGLTRPQDATLASDLGADAAGMVFYPASPRHVADYGLAREVVQSLHPWCLPTAVVVNPSIAEVEALLGQVGIRCLQFHGDETPQFCAQFNVPYVKAMRMRPNSDIQSIIDTHTSAVGILLDTYKQSMPGGTGEIFDWAMAQKLQHRYRIVAGGLNPENVKEAIEKSAIRSVDVSSGVESSPGSKDPQKLRDLFTELKTLNLIERKS